MYSVANIDGCKGQGWQCSRLLRHDDSPLRVRPSLEVVCGRTLPWRPSPSGCTSTVMSVYSIDQSGVWVKPVCVKQRACDRSSSERTIASASVEWHSTADEGGGLLVFPAIESVVGISLLYTRNLQRLGSIRPVDIWRQWAEDVAGGALSDSHLQS